MKDNSDYKPKEKGPQGLRASSRLDSMSELSLALGFIFEALDLGKSVENTP